MRYDDPQRPRSDLAGGELLQVSGSPLPCITLIAPHNDPARGWGWLASIHAHRKGNIFSHHSGFIMDLNEFATAYMRDPEEALASYFAYLGPSKDDAPRGAKSVGSTWDDIFG
jgi:hypothetical protein